MQIEPLIEKAVATSQSNEELVDNLAAIESTIIEVAKSIVGRTTDHTRTKEALFPPKRSGFVIHPQATYDAYILTIGSGRGDNWWCALFPKICFPDKEKKRKKKKSLFSFGSG